MNQKLEQLIVLFQQLEAWDVQGRRSISSGNAPLSMPESDSASMETPLSRMINQYSELINQIQELVENELTEEIPNYLISCLKHSSMVVRLQAVDALGYTRNTNAIAVLVDVMQNDKDTGVRVAAAQALGIIGDVLATPALVDLLQSDILQTSEVKLHWATAQALSFIGDPNAADALIDALACSYGAFEEQASEVREAVRDALVSIGGEVIVDKLIELWAKPELNSSEDVDLFIRHEMLVPLAKSSIPRP